MKTIAPIGFGHYVLQAEFFDGGRRLLEFVHPDFPPSVSCCFYSGLLIPTHFPWLF